MDRVILHSDLNNFYASVECLYNPEIRDKPVAVCGSESERHGIVLAKNYIAKKFGVKTAEVIWQAKQKCPNLVVVRPNYNRYLKFSKLAREIYMSYTNEIESFGIDECWLDVTQSTRIFGSGEKIAFEIKERIKEELGITASVGVSYNKIFAKLGSDMKKPDAVTLISKENFKKTIWNLPVEELLYVGRSTKKQLNRINILTIGQLANSHLPFLKNCLGKWGETLWFFANGFDESPVTRQDYEQSIKGIGNSMTAPRDLTCNDDVKILLHVLAESVGERLRKHNLKGKTVQISIKDKNLSYIERQAQLTDESNINSEIASKAYDIFLKTWNWNNDIRALGVRLTSLKSADGYSQLSFLDDNRRIKREAIDKCVDNIRGRFGHYSVQRALILSDNKLNANPIEENIIHPQSYFR